jgi:hypothetical protein
MTKECIEQSRESIGLQISHRIIYITVVSRILYVSEAAIGWVSLDAASSSLKAVCPDCALPMQYLVVANFLYAMRKEQQIAGMTYKIQEGTQGDVRA